MGDYTGFSWAVKTTPEKVFNLPSDLLLDFQQTERHDWLFGGSDNEFPCFRLSYENGILSAQGSVKNFDGVIRKFEKLLQSLGDEYVLLQGYEYNDFVEASYFTTEVSEIQFSRLDKREFDLYDENHHALVFLSKDHPYKTYTRRDPYMSYFY